MKKSVTLFVTSTGSKVQIEAPEKKAKTAFKKLYPGIEITSETHRLEIDYEPKKPNK